METKETNKKVTNKVLSNGTSNVRSTQTSFVIGIAKNHKISNCKCNNCNGQ